MSELQNLYNLCKSHREKGEHLKSINYFNLAIKLLKIDDILTHRMNNIKYNEEVKLFIYKFFEEFTIISYYINRKEEGLIISDKLMFDRDSLRYLNDDVVYNIARNQKYYMNKLECVSKKMIDIIPERNFVGMNPSIIKKEKGYLMNYRTSNFGLRPGGIYYCRSNDGIIDTINYILELDVDLNVISKRKVTDKSKTKTYPRSIKGLEDLIIFEYSPTFSDDGSKEIGLWGTCTLLDTNIHGTPQIGLCNLELSSNGSEYVINTKLPFKLGNIKRPEKNWLPFVENGKLKLIYGYSPTEIITPINKDDHLEYKVVTFNNTKLNFERFRGSAAPLKFKEGWLIIVHEVSWNHDNSRVYTHRFIYMDHEFKIKKISNPWYFESHGIEFCRSMCYSHTLDEIIITCGIKDEEGWCYLVNIEYIFKELNDLEYYEL